MATTTITNAAALADMLDFARSAGWDNTAAIERLEKHLVSLERSAERSSGPSKSQVENDAIIEGLAEYLATLEAPVTVKDIAQWITDNRSEIAVCSVQKATAIATRGYKTGKLERVFDGKKIVFTAAKPKD